MNKKLFSVALCLNLCGCTTYVYAPTDTDASTPTGNVESLTSLLPPATTQIDVVFIHGVGDTFPGFAFNESTGWLNTATTKTLGLTLQDKGQGPRTIAACVFRHKDEAKCDPAHSPPADAESFVQFDTRTYSAKLNCPSPAAPTCVRELKVRAIEITWSGLTQWLKTEGLYFDVDISPPVFCKARTTGDPSQLPCVQPPDTSDTTHTPALPYPPERVLANKMLKEQILDRNLSDAVIYAGPYGKMIERGVAQAICRASREEVVSAATIRDLCVWPGEPNPTTRYLFVTHSLGSRILYDMWIDLLAESRSDESTFSEKEHSDSLPFVSRMLVQTPATYMMANQWALVGLATVPAMQKPGDCPQAHCGNRIGLVGQERSRHRHLGQGGHGKDHDKTGDDLTAILRVVAFSDSNDLLTWQVPPAYVGPTPEKKGTSADVEVVNVVGQNAVRWGLGPVAFEWPPSAHADYFSRSYVWNIIRCGAANGKPLSC